MYYQKEGVAKHSKCSGFIRVHADDFVWDDEFNGFIEKEYKM